MTPTPVVTGVALVLVSVLVLTAAPGPAQFRDAAGQLRVALVRQPFVPNGTSAGPTTMADGGIQPALKAMGATVRVNEIKLTADQEPEYGGWKRLGFALGHLGRAVAANVRDGYFNVGLLGTCPSMPGMVAGLQHSGPSSKPLRVGMLWLDAHPDFNTPETTRSGSLGGMPVAVATGRCLRGMRLDAGLDPPLADEHVVMGGVRLTDPLEQAPAGQVAHRAAHGRGSANDVARRHARTGSARRITDPIYVHIDMDVLDPREVEGHQNKVPGGPSSEELAKLFEMIFSRYPKAGAIGFATIPARDEGGLSIAALNRMILGAVRGLSAAGAERAFASSSSPPRPNPPGRSPTRQEGQSEEGSCDDTSRRSQRWLLPARWRAQALPAPRICADACLRPG